MSRPVQWPWLAWLRTPEAKRPSDSQLLHDLYTETSARLIPLWPELHPGHQQPLIDGHVQSRRGRFPTVRYLEFLNEAALVERGLRGRLARMDRARLLRRWAADAPLEKRGEQAMFLEPRGLSALVESLKSAGSLKYSVTGSLAA